MIGKGLIATAAFAALAVAVAGCGGSSSSSTGSAASTTPQSSGTINGAGATFPAPVYQEWAARLKDASGLTVNYQAIGSGGGIAQFTAKTVDFGATDAAMKDEEVAAAQKVGEPVHVPTVFGAVTVAYNVTDVATGLKLDGATVADLFLGKITKWNDPAIAALNSGVTLPATDVTVCHRSDESGTTKLFTTFLNAYSPEWKSKVGSDKAVQWPTGTGAKGNDGVAACVKQSDGAVGYVEEAYALAEQLHHRRAEEQGRQLHHGLDPASRPRPPARASRCPPTCGSTPSTRRARRRTRSHRPRSCWSTRTCARPATASPRPRT